MVALGRKRCIHKELNMGYITFMVQMEPGRSNAAMLQATRYMAERFQAHVVGITVC